MGSAKNGGGGQHPAPEGRQIGNPPPPGIFMTPSLIVIVIFLEI